MVAGVSEKMETVRSHISDLRGCPPLTIDLQEPEVVERIMNSIQSIADEAQRALADPELSRKDLLEAIAVGQDNRVAIVVLMVPRIYRRSSTSTMPTSSILGYRTRL